MGTGQGATMNLPDLDLLSAEREQEWKSRLSWLRSLGMADKTISTYRLDRYWRMTEGAWLCMVMEALRSFTSLSAEQTRRKVEEWKKKHEKENENVRHRESREDTRTNTGRGQ